MSSDTAATLQPMLRTLRLWGSLRKEDERAVLALPHVVRPMKAQQYLVWDGDRPQLSTVLLSGFAYRHKIAPDGSRQVLSIDMAGDFVDLQNALVGRADHNVQMITEGLVALVPVEEILAIAAERPQVGFAMWRTTLLEAGVFRQWITNVGRRNAHARISHLLCEFAWRADIAGLGDHRRYVLPLTQEQLSDAVSLTPIHVNRTLGDLARSELVELGRRSIGIRNWDGLAAMGGFDSSYLSPMVAQVEPSALAARGGSAAQGADRSSSGQLNS